MFILNLYIGFSCIMFAQITDSYNMYVLDRNGRLSKPDGVIHIDSKDMSHAMRERLVKQVNEYLRQPKKGMQAHYNNMIKTDKSKKKKRDPDEYKNIAKSPVGYSNGRYTLDLDRIDVRDLHDASKKSDEEDDEYFDPAESFRDYYDYISINDRLATNDKIPWRQLKHLTKYLKSRSLRKYNRLLGDEKYFKTRNIESGEHKRHIKRKKKVTPKKRFQIVDNNKGKKKKKYGRNSDEAWVKNVDMMEKIKVNYDSDFQSPPDLSEEEVPKHKRKKHKRKDKKLDDSDNDDDETTYLQGNVLIKVNNRHSYADKVDSDADNDRRRRLPHFLPKRYHWDPEDIHKLGYFWFNGPRGKYPEPVLAD